MGYSEEILRLGRQRLEEAKAEKARENEVRRRIAYTRSPRLEEIERELRLTLSRVVATTFRNGENTAQAIDRLREHNLALQHERDWILEAMDMEGYLDDKPYCENCGSSGYIGAQMCGCLHEFCRQEQRKALTSLLDSGSDGFEDFRLDVYPDTYDPKIGTSPRHLMQSNLRICKRYAQEFTPSAGSLFFCGATGLGKTFLSACIARQVADRGFSVVYDTAIHLFSDFEREKFDYDGESRGLSQKYLNCDLLIIDDLGTEMTTQFTVSALYTVVNTRMMENRATIISTNLADTELERRYNPQIASRITGTYRLIQFAGNDIRRA